MSIFIFSLLLSLLGCSTLITNSATIDEVNRPLLVISQAIAYGLSKQILKTSPNRRVIYSKYHKPGKKLTKNARLAEERAQAIVYILKERRPYKIIVEYRLEVKGPNGYISRGSQKKDAEKIKDRIANFLASRPDNRDLIDDFRAF